MGRISGADHTSPGDVGFEEPRAPWPGFFSFELPKSSAAALLIFPPSHFVENFSDFSGKVADRERLREKMRAGIQNTIVDDGVACVAGGEEDL